MVFFIISICFAVGCDPQSKNTDTTTEQVSQEKAPNIFESKQNPRLPQPQTTAVKNVSRDELEGFS